MIGLVFRKLQTMLRDERRERRSERREEISLGTVEIAGRSCPVKNWSATGFLAGPCECDCQQGDSLDIRFHVKVPGKTVHFGCKAILVRVDKNSGDVAGVFTLMEREVRLLIANHFD